MNTQAVIKAVRDLEFIQKSLSKSERALATAAADGGTTYAYFRQLLGIVDWQSREFELYVVTRDMARQLLLDSIENMKSQYTEAEANIKKLLTEASEVEAIGADSEG